MSHDDPSETNLTEKCRHESNRDTCSPKARVLRRDREAVNGHRAAALWFTGLSGSGKSTLAHALEERLHRRGVRTYVFDGDKIRHGLCADLSFSAEDRTENVRRIAESVKLFLDAGVVCFCAFISPMRAVLGSQGPQGPAAVLQGEGRQGRRARRQGRVRPEQLE
ncbi:adenylyl-sulfate kinase, partial [Desulfovibrio sp.]